MLNALEVASAGTKRVEVADVERAVGQRALRYGREEHYDVISAFIKSVRGERSRRGASLSCQDARGGGGPRVRGQAARDPGLRRYRQRRPARSPTRRLGRRGSQAHRDAGGTIPLAQATTYLATAPKSNAAYAGINAALADVRHENTPEVPMHLRNAVTGLMKEEIRLRLPLRSRRRA